SFCLVDLSCFIIFGYSKYLIMKIKIFTLVALLAGLFLGSCQKKNPVVEIQTSKGNIVVELYLDKAPITAGNFLNLVKDGVYEGASFYRSVRPGNERNPISISVVQGGIQHKEGHARVQSIEHENTDMTGIKHLDGTMSMARGRPGSASSEFFICMGDQPELDIRGRRNADGQGFAAFGQVIDGYKVLQDIWGSPAIGESLDPRIIISNIKLK
ncbi:MAG: peptidylprolyl isomerase, partial [Bacteroidales bacterium]|nr:peptidylprolyl isomerase [Bacteroidales bacterium]